MTQPSESPSGSSLAEIQGLYGAFTFSEKLLQKIWLRRDFDHVAVKLSDGRRLRVIHPGRWNLLGGPDFRQARLRFDDGPEILGDVELHLRAADWDAHAHAADPAYNGVVLHVVLFEPEAGHVSRGFDGRALPVLTLLPLLHHDLEAYATDEAVEALSGRPTNVVTEELAGIPTQKLLEMLALHAARRWQQKLRFAGLRLQRLGWEAACHQSALEVLGFRYNRAPMLRVAAQWPLERWRNGTVTIDEPIFQERDAWSVQGVRPANQPRARLHQYQAWVVARPDWPDRLVRLAATLPDLPVAGGTGAIRRQGRLTAVRERIADEVCAGALGGSRLDTLICDAFLPLAAVRSGELARAGLWFHWFAGDFPDFVAASLRELGVCNAREQPICHGLGQGLMGWLIEREVRR